MREQDTGRRKLAQRRRLSAAAGLLAALAALAGCGANKAETPPAVHVGVTYYNQTDTFVSELLDHFSERVQEAAGTAADTSVRIVDAGGSQRTQDEQVREMIDSGCNVVCVNLVDRANPSAIIDMAQSAGVPIIFFNREPVLEDLQQWDQLYYVGADARESGEMQGLLAVKALEQQPRADRNGDGCIQYVVLEGEPGHQDAIIRTESAVDAIAAAGVRLQKLSYQTANWSRPQAQNRMTQLIGQYQSDIELVIANNDDMALGAADAYSSLNYTDDNRPLIFGVDGTTAGLAALADGRIDGTVYNDKEGQAKAMARQAVALVTGKADESLQFDENRRLYVPYQRVAQTEEEGGLAGR